MKYLHLVWAGLFRKKVRTVLTVLSVIVAFLLFGLLQAVNEAFQAGAEQARADRLITNSRYSIIEMLPISYLPQIESVPGVKEVAFASWFGGSYQDRPAQFAVFPVDPERYLRAAPEIELDDAARERWQATRDGAVVGQSLAERYGWQVGDRVTLVADIWPQRGGNNEWNFEISGIYTSPGSEQNEGALLFQWEFFDEARQYARGTVGWFILQVEDPDRAEDVAQAVDALFENSSNETKTQTEKAFAQGFARQFGDIGLIVTAILGAVFFTILVLTGNTMAQAVRERVPELAILKTLGFSDRAVLGLVVAESLVLVLLGGLIGLGLAAAALGGLGAMLAGFGIQGISLSVVGMGVLLMVALSLVVGLPPAWRAMRLRVVDALGGHQ
ncbi:ABC transporter permease [Thioalkalivibrio sp. XN279]|uniref:ABC transporter permease n=1 Tax=Thioalkalivibrio sp. XN279 TaxID=2714953 RepID=UPI00140A3B50|nr:ABC transporter permease [Thioalkalivibrio sp. XN279]NHA13802.1 FtsX-like permease family protein [Thioalkalivibrio sp. XN279]